MEMTITEAQVQAIGDAPQEMMLATVARTSFAVIAFANVWAVTLCLVYDETDKKNYNKRDDGCARNGVFGSRSFP